MYKWGWHSIYWSYIYSLLALKVSFYSLACFLPLHLGKNVSELEMPWGCITFNGRTVISYHLDKRTCLFICRSHSNKWKPESCKWQKSPPSVVFVQCWWLWSIVWSSHMHQHLIGAGKVLDGGGPPSPLKMFLLVCHSGCSLCEVAFASEPSLRQAQVSCCAHV